MLRERIAPHSEVIRVIVLEGSPCREVPGPGLDKAAELGVAVRTG